MKNNKGHANIWLVVSVVIVAIVAGYFAFQNIEQPNSKLLSYQDIEREMCAAAPEKGIVLKNQKEFSALKRGICKSDPLKIDFSKNSVLGMNVRTRGCGADFEKKILQDNLAKEIRYSVKVTPSGNCEMIVKKNNWVLIDKIPNDFRVIFNQYQFQ